MGEPRLYPVEVDRKTAYINAEGDVILPPQFDSGESFHEDRALVANFTPGETDPKTGSVAIPPIACEAVFPFDGELAETQDADGQIWYINRNGEFVWPLRG